MIELPVCHLRGAPDDQGHYSCASNWLVKPFGYVTAEVCRICPYADRAGAPPNAPPRPKPRIRCIHLGLCVLDRRGVLCQGKWVRACDLHGSCTFTDPSANIAVCSQCGDYREDE